MPRLPLIPTLVVGLAVAAMIALGIWQLDRRHWKESLIERFAANTHAPAMAFPRPPVGDEHLYRRASAMCVAPLDWERRGGRSANGTSGYRMIATCLGGGAEGPALKVAMGVTRDPKSTPEWKGGEVTGTIVHMPDERPLLASMFGKVPPRGLMLVADTPAPGLEPNAKPDPSEVPNNHLAYAVQWFIFAGIALVIYLLALRWRQKRAQA